MSIRKTNIGSSASIQIPLKDPVEKFGRTFRVNQIFVDNGTAQPELEIIKDETGERLYSQEVHSRQINLRWSVTEPRSNNVIKNASLVEKNQYIDSFDVFVYRQDESTLNNPSFDGGPLIFSSTGILNNKITIDASGERNRYLNVSVVLNDKFGHKETGYLYVYNPPPTGAITSFEKYGGNFNIEYTGSNDLEGINMYLFTGANSYGQLENTEEFKSSNKIKSVNYDRSGSMPLIPDRNNYILALPFDSLGEGGPIPLVSENQDPYKASGINFYPAVRGIDITKVEAGSRSLIKLDYDWQNHQVVDLVYSIDGTGELSRAVSGYQGNILLDKSKIDNQVSTETSDSSSFYFDHMYDFVSNTSLGVLEENESSKFSSGAGSYFKNNEVLYSGESGLYEYAYYDVDNSKICFHTFDEIKSGDCYVNGTFSMEADNPNALDIKFRGGEKFSNIYEVSSSYLNQIFEMPAVILNKSQFNQMNSYSGARGWIGLRRNNIGLFKDLFDSNVKNQATFGDFIPEEFNSGQLVNNNQESIEFVSNDVGSGWSWVNSSGSHLYREITSGFNKDYNVVFNLDFIKKENNKKIGGYTKGHTFKGVELENITYTNNTNSFRIYYDIINSEFKKNKNNLDITRIDFYTGDNQHFEPSEENYFKTTNVDLKDESSVISTNTNSCGVNFDGHRPKYMKFSVGDLAGSGSIYSIEGELEYLASKQNTSFPLDGVGTSFNVPFENNHTSQPTVSFNVNYTGSSTPIFINGMMVGEPSISGADFLLNQAAPTNGYVLNIISESLDLDDD